MKVHTTCTYIQHCELHLFPGKHHYKEPINNIITMYLYHSLAEYILVTVMLYAYALTIIMIIKNTECTTVLCIVFNI